jgi:hypothetical protein
MTGVPRLEARERVRSAVDRVLNLWRAGHAVSWAEIATGFVAAAFQTAALKAVRPSARVP